MSTQPGRRRESAAALPGGSTCCQRVGIQLSGYQKSAKGAGRLSRESRLRARRIGWNPIARPDCRVNATTRRPAIAPGWAGPPDSSPGWPSSRAASSAGPRAGHLAAASSMARGMPSNRRISARPRPSCAPTVRRRGWPRLPGREQQAGLGRGDRRGRAIGRQSQRRHREDQLTGNIQAFPAGGQEPQPPALGQQRGHQVRRRLQDVLAVVQHHQQPRPASARTSPAAGVGASRSDTPRACATLAGTRPGSVRRAQFDQPGAVPEAGLASAATRSASRVLPHPPGPVSVTTRPPRSRSRTAAISGPRPTSELTSAGNPGCCCGIRAVCTPLNRPGRHHASYAPVNRLI